MSEQKYPPGVRFVFLLALSAFTAFLSIHLASAGVADRSGSWVLFAISTVMSLSVFVIALLPWAKDRRKRTFVTGLALFLVGTLFLIADLDRAGWLEFLTAIFLACSILYLTRHGFVPNHQRRPVGVLGYILLSLTFLITPVLTIFSIYVVAETRADEVFLLITPAWLLFSGIILKVAGSGGGIWPRLSRSFFPVSFPYSSRSHCLHFLWLPKIQEAIRKCFMLLPLAHP